MKASQTATPVQCRAAEPYRGVRTCWWPSGARGEHSQTCHGLRPDDLPLKEPRSVLCQQLVRAEATDEVGWEGREPLEGGCVDRGGGEGTIRKREGGKQ